MTIEIKVDNGRANIYTPYNPQFVRAIKQIGGAKWNPAQKCWSIPEAAIEAARGIMTDVYGCTDVSGGETITVKATFAEEVTAHLADVVLFGKVLAHATGRDSGARVGDDVAFSAGGVTSGGGARNWQSVVREGSVAILSNVSKSLYDKAVLPDGVTVEIMDSKIDREALLAEKARLLKRLAEIETLLA